VDPGVYKGRGTSKLEFTGYCQKQIDIFVRGPTIFFKSQKGAVLMPLQQVKYLLVCFTIINFRGY